MSTEANKALIREFFEQVWNQGSEEAIDRFIAEGDTVVARWTLTGTQTGPFLGIAPTGRTIGVGGMSMDHLRDGLLVSGFDGWDNLGLRQQLGAIPDDPKA